MERVGAALGGDHLQVGRSREGHRPVLWHRRLLARRSLARLADRAVLRVRAVCDSRAAATLPRCAGVR